MDIVKYGSPEYKELIGRSVMVRKRVASTVSKIIDAVRAYATVGEICEALRQVYLRAHGVQPELTPEQIAQLQMDAAEKIMNAVVQMTQKMMNEIESDVAGKVVKILVKNGQPVEFGQALMIIEPSA